jgi:5'-nucleotidase
MKPLILITNDDGIFSPGLKAAAEAVAPLGDLLIAAPKVQQTAMSRALPKGAEVGIIEPITLPINGASYPAYKINGSPAQAVAHAVIEIAQRKPDLCISGINYGENVGAGVAVSGTVGAALEASSLSVPALAMSIETDPSMHHASDYGEVNWATAMHFTRYFAEKLLARGLPEGTAVLNVNVPASATPDTPVKVTRLSHKRYYKYIRKPDRDLSQPYYFAVEINRDPERLEPDSDIHVFRDERLVSVTPLSWDMTAKIVLDEWYRGFVE